MANHSRSALIRTAASLPVGHPHRKVILAVLKGAATSPAFDDYEAISNALTQFERSYSRDKAIKDPRGVARAIDKIQAEMYHLGKAAGWFA